MAQKMALLVGFLRSTLDLVSPTQYIHGAIFIERSDDSVQESNVALVRIARSVRALLVSPA